MTAMSSLGCSAGAKPMNEATYCDVGYSGVIGSILVAVPGLPASLWRGFRTALLAWQVDARLVVEPEAPHPVVEALAAHLQADLDRPDVGGLGEDLGGGQGHGAPHVRLADDAVGHVDLRRQVERRLRGHRPVLQRARDGDRLERRARLV